MDNDEDDGLPTMPPPYLPLHQQEAIHFLDRVELATCHVVPLRTDAFDAYACLQLYYRP